MLDVLLAAALVVGLHLVDAIAARGGHLRLINVGGMLRVLRDHPSAPANWWIYLTLFSTLIPSALNLCIGMVSVVAWFPRRWRMRVHNTLRDVGEKGFGSTLWEIRFGLAAQTGLGVFGAGVVTVGVLYLLSLAGPTALDMYLGLAEALEGKLAS